MLFFCPRLLRQRRRQWRGRQGRKPQGSTRLEQNLHHHHWRRKGTRWCFEQTQLVWRRRLSAEREQDWEKPCRFSTQPCNAHFQHHALGRRAQKSRWRAAQSGRVPLREQGELHDTADSSDRRRRAFEPEPLAQFRISAWFGRAAVFQSPGKRPSFPFASQSVQYGRCVFQYGRRDGAIIGSCVLRRSDQHGHGQHGVTVAKSDWSAWSAFSSAATRPGISGK